MNITITTKSLEENVQKIYTSFSNQLPNQTKLLKTVGGSYVWVGVSQYVVVKNEYESNMLTESCHTFKLSLDLNDFFLVLLYSFCTIAL